MADDNKKSDGDKNQPKGGEFRMPPKTWLIWIVILASIISLMLVKDRIQSPSDKLEQFAFQKKVEAGQIISAVINYNPQTSAMTEIVGTYQKVDADGAPSLENG